jgi:hypothetical protein
MAITYHLSNLILDNLAHGPLNDFVLATASNTSGGTVRAVGSASGSTIYVHHTSAGQPGVADWPNASYKVQYDISSAGANVTFGLLTIGARTGHFGRVSSGTSVDLETAQQAEAAFAGTGLKLATVTWNPAAGGVSDRFDLCMVAANTANMAQNLQVSLFNLTSTFAIWGEETPVATGGTPERTKMGGGF